MLHMIYGFMVDGDGACVRVHARSRVFLYSLHIEQ